MSNITIKDSVVFVTGANKERGIGRAIVLEALNRGAKKVYATSRNLSQLDDLVEKGQGKVVAIQLDVTNKEQIANAAKEASDTQILINNSGIAGFGGVIYNYDEESARQELEVNYFGPLNLTRALSESIISNGNGAVATVSSIAGLSTFPMAATYSASKAAAHSFIQSARAELTPQGVSVFGIYPGPIDTELADGVEMEKETPANVAIRIFDGIEQGVEDITTDKFGDEFVKNFKADAKALEKEFGEGAHQPQTA